MDDDTCRARLHLRNQRAEHEFAATDAEFELITSYFCEPDEGEGHREHGGLEAGIWPFTVQQAAIGQ